MFADEIRGLQALQQKAAQVVRDLHGQPMLDAMRKAAVLVSTDAKQLVPVDTGRLRSSITPDVRQEGFNVLGVVGSNVLYAPYMETGTRPHWPPTSALEVWARRHGVDAFLVARAISKRGTKGHRYLQGAFEKNTDKIKAILGGAVEGIINT